MKSSKSAYSRSRKMSNNKQSSVGNEFVPYEQALELKQLGFDGHCFAFYQEEYVEKYTKNGLMN
jgi:hypothetical protein